MAQDDPKTGKVQVMDHFVSLTYEQTGTSVGREFAVGLLEGKIVGHKCPTCGRVYVPPKGFCPMDATVTTKAEHGVDTTPQTFIDGRRIGGNDDLRRFFGLRVTAKGETSYRPVIEAFINAGGTTNGVAGLP